jgi:hypothetical protein
MRLLALQVLEQGRKTGDKRRLGRLEQRHHGVPELGSKPPAALQSRNQGDPEAGRARVQLIQREPDDLPWDTACGSVSCSYDRQTNTLPHVASAPGRH